MPRAKSGPKGKTNRSLRTKAAPKRPTVQRLADQSAPEMLDETARLEWGRIVPEIERLRGFTALDRAMAVAYCQAWSDYKQAREWIAANGRVQVFRDDKGVVKASQVAPQWTIACKALDNIRRAAVDLGIVGAARFELEAALKQAEKVVGPIDSLEAALEEQMG